MNKIFFFIFNVIISGQALACPGCLGTNPKDKYYLYIIGAFILLCYVPMYFLFKMIFKMRNINNSQN